MDIDCWKLFRLPGLGGIGQKLKTVAPNLALREQTCSNEIDHAGNTNCPHCPQCKRQLFNPTLHLGPAMDEKKSGFGSNLAIAAVKNQLFWMLQVRYAKQTRQGTTNLTDRGAFDVGEGVRPFASECYK